MRYNEAEAQLTQERLELSSIESSIKKLIDTKISSRPETTLAYRSAQMATMWLGKAKGALGIRSPYPASLDASSNVIEPRADFNPSIMFEGVKDEIGSIKALRAALKKSEAAIKNDRQILTNHAEYQLCVLNAYTNCCNATMWLGMVLNAIKNEAEKKLVEPIVAPPINPPDPATGKEFTGDQPEVDSSQTISSGDSLTVTPPVDASVKTTATVVVSSAPVFDATTQEQNAPVSHAPATPTPSTTDAKKPKTIRKPTTPKKNEQ